MAAAESSDEIVLGAIPRDVVELVYCSRSNLVRVVIPNSVEEIPSFAFCGCQALVEVVISVSQSKLRIIGDDVFIGTALKEFHTPKNVQCIGYGAFANIKSLTKFTVPNGSALTYIGKGAFKNCIALKAIDLSAALQVTKLERLLFWECSALESSLLPPKLIQIYFKSFAGCYSLQTVVLPDTVRQIDEGAFDGCRSLKSFRIPAGLGLFERAPFQGCSSLHTVQFPSTGHLHQLLASQPFVDCTSIHAIELPGRIPVPLWYRLIWQFSNHSGVLHLGGIRTLSSCTFHFLRQNIQQYFEYRPRRSVRRRRQPRYLVREQEE